MQSNQQGLVYQRNFTSQERTYLRTFKIAILATHWNKPIIDNLMWGAKKILKSLEIEYQIFLVPGAFEVPYAAQKIFQQTKTSFDGIIAFGCVIRGDTYHFKAIADTVSRNIIRVALKFDKPIAFGILTTENFAQAQARSLKNNENKGIEATNSLLDLLIFEKSLK